MVYLFYSLNWRITFRHPATYEDKQPGKQEEEEEEEHFANAKKTERSTEGKSAVSSFWLPGFRNIKGGRIPNDPRGAFFSLSPPSIAEHIFFGTGGERGGGESSRIAAKEGKVDEPLLLPPFFFPPISPRGREERKEKGKDEKTFLSLVVEAIPFPYRERRRTLPFPFMAH